MNAYHGYFPLSLLDRGILAPKYWPTKHLPLPLKEIQFLQKKNCSRQKCLKISLSLTQTPYTDTSLIQKAL